MRWALALQEFDVSFKYKEGKRNTAADCLCWAAPSPANRVGYARLCCDCFALISLFCVVLVCVLLCLFSCSSDNGSSTLLMNMKMSLSINPEHLLGRRRNVRVVRHQYSRVISRTRRTLTVDQSRGQTQTAVGDVDRLMLQMISRRWA